jgi:hypothetical protein
MPAPQVISEVWAFIATEADGSEGVMAVTRMQAGQMWTFPLVGADPANIPRMLELAQDAERQSGRPFRICKFVIRRDVTEEYV